MTSSYVIYYAQGLNRTRPIDGDQTNSGVAMVTGDHFYLVPGEWFGRPRMLIGPASVTKVSRWLSLFKDRKLKPEMTLASGL